ncbi:MAG: GNAT family N-acetyltransferase [Acidobacteriota bacterium]
MWTVIRKPSRDTLENWARAWPVEREVDNNLALGIARRGGGVTYAAGVAPRSEAQAHSVVALTEVEFSLGPLPVDAAAPLVDDLLAAGVESMPGVHGPTELSRRLAELWCERRGTTATRGMHNRFYALDRLLRPSPTPSGSARQATEDDVDTVAEWLVGFAEDADLPSFDTVAKARSLIGEGDVSLWLDPEPVSMSALSGRTARTARVGYVFTPRDARGRGYGAAATTASVEHARRTGVERCCLFADVENPLTNRLYQRLGFTARFETTEFVFA